MCRLLSAVCLAGFVVTVTGCAILSTRLTPTPSEPSAITGLVMLEKDGNYIIGVNWTSRSRVTYRVTGGDTTLLRNYVGETVTVHGVVFEKSAFLKELVIQRIDTEVAQPGSLSQRSGIVQRLGMSIYMQGSHKLLDEKGGLICLLSSKTAKVDLDGYVGRQVKVTGTLAKTVEGNAWIMDVLLVEPVN
ncbi:MAG: hypothetical protein H5T64_02200 [Chloroflexi bacterium]|nr:hypothetical protein [Chloroflexota bacterium]